MKRKTVSPLKYSLTKLQTLIKKGIEDENKAEA
jgi:hypothetical protein